MNLIDQHADTLRRMAKKPSRALLTKAERDLMIILAASEPITIGNAARFAGLHHTAATRITEQLHNRGLVSRVRHREDRRRLYVSITDAGRELLTNEYEGL